MDRYRAAAWICKLDDRGEYVKFEDAQTEIANLKSIVDGRNRRVIKLEAHIERLRAYINKKYQYQCDVFNYNNETEELLESTPIHPYPVISQA